MKKLTCHCGAVEAEIKMYKLEKFCDVIALSAKEKAL